MGRLRDHDSGVSVRGSSYLYAPNATSVGNTGSGYSVARGSFADLEGSEASSNDSAGYVSKNSSGIYAYSTDSYGNGDGYVAATSSSLEAWASTSYGNRFGYMSTDGSFLMAMNSQALESVANDYLTGQNGVIYASGAVGDISIWSTENDVDDFVIGL